MNDRSFNVEIEKMQNPAAEAGTRRDKSVARRRRQILEAAVMCFLEAGYHQTGVRDIAKRAGVSLGNLYNHFPGKHDLLAEIAMLERSDLDPFLALLSDPSPAPEVLDRFVTAYATYLAAPENVILTTEIVSEAIRKPDIAAMFVENRALLVSAVRELLQRGAAEGHFRALPDPEETAHLVIALIDGSAYRSVLEGVDSRRTQAALKDLISAAVAAC